MSYTEEETCTFIQYTTKDEVRAQGKHTCVTVKNASEIANACETSTYTSEGTQALLTVNQVKSLES